MKIETILTPAKLPALAYAGWAQQYLFHYIRTKMD